MIEDRNIRIFLSSTFADMQEERNYLIKKIFPAIKQLCLSRNVDFSVVDLRWGITEEEAQTGRVVEICMDEIERTQPFFIGLIGGRYGWIPPSGYYKENTRLYNRYPWIQDCIDQGMSITEIEIQYGVLRNTDSIHAHFFVKDERIIPEKYKEESDSESEKKLIKLKESIRDYALRGRCKLSSYRSIRQLGQIIYKQIVEMIDQLYPEADNNPIIRNMLRQEARIKSLQEVYVNSNSIESLEWLVTESNFNKYIQYRFNDFKNESTNREKWCIVIKGERGCGKSALLANWHSDSHRVIKTFLGRELNQRKDIITLFDIYKSDYNCEDSQDIIWIIDSLESLVDENDRALAWLKDMNVNLIVSTNDDTQETILANMFHRHGTLKVEPPKKEELVSICKAYLQQFAKGLTLWQLETIASTPLFSNMELLRIFLDELVQFGIYEELDSFMCGYLDSEYDHDFIIHCLKRIENDYGKDIVCMTLGMLGLTKIGISLDDIKEICKLSNLELSALYTAIKPFVAESGNLLYIDKNIVYDVIKERYHKGETIRIIEHALLSVYENILERASKNTSFKQKIANKCFRLPMWYGSGNEELCYHVYCESAELKISLYGIEKFMRNITWRNLFFYSQSKVVVSSVVSLIYNNPSAIRLSAYDLNWIYLCDAIDDCLDMMFVYLQANTEALYYLKAKISSMWLLLPNCKRKIIKLIDERLEKDVLPWDKFPLKDLKLHNLISIVNELPYFISDETIRDYGTKLDSLLVQVHGEDCCDEAVLSILKVLKAYCMFRSGHNDDAYNLFGEVLQISPELYNSLFYYSFVLNYGVSNYQQCNDIISNLHHQINTFSGLTKFKMEEMLIRMEMTMSARYNNCQEVEKLSKDISRIYLNLSDNPNRMMLQQQAIENSLYWHEILKQPLATAFLNIAMAENELTEENEKSNFLFYAGFDFVNAKEYAKAKEISRKALDSHLTRVEYGLEEFDDEFFGPLEWACEESGDYSQYRDVLREKEGLYKKRGMIDEMLNEMTKEAKSFYSEAGLCDDEKRINDLSQRGLQIYRDIQRIDTEIAHFPSRNNRLLNFCKYIVYYRLHYNCFVDENQLILEVIGVVQTLVNSVEDDIKETCSETLCYAYASLCRWDEAVPYVMSAVRLLLRRWDEPELQSYTMEYIASWFPDQLETLFVPIIESIADNEEDPLNKNAIATLIILYNRKGNNTEFRKWRDKASQIITKEKYYEGIYNPLYHAINLVRWNNH